jgi:hypothetical protein
MRSRTLRRTADVTRALDQGEITMLSDKDALATVAVKSLESAGKFYEQTLGLTKIMENEEAGGDPRRPSTMSLPSIAIDL